MANFFKRLGKSLLIPAVVLSISGVLLGIGYIMAPVAVAGKESGFDAEGILYVAGTFFVNVGKALIDNMPVLFAVGISVGMSKDGDGTAGLAGLVSCLVITGVWSLETAGTFTGVAAGAFEKGGNALIGILSGLIGAGSYNRFRGLAFPERLSFFNGKRAVPVMAALLSVPVAGLLLFIWPAVYRWTAAFGKVFSGFGAVSAGIYVFFNRLLLPFGLDRALNSVFLSDASGIADLTNFWNGGGLYGQTGMYMTGFFPFMLLGIPAACLAMYHTADSDKKTMVCGLFLSVAFCSFFTGVTAPAEFIILFFAPGLYFIHTLLAGITAGITAALPVRAGFSLSGGLIDLTLSSFMPLARNPWLLIPVSAGTAVIYYLLFRFAIVRFDLKTPGRERETGVEKKRELLKNNDFAAAARTILDGVGGKGNVKQLDYCVTRLRLELKDYTLINEKKIRLAGVAGIIRPKKYSVQVVVGMKVPFVAEEMKKMV
ncbi:MAG: PTS transporter subunit EIIC [Lachnospiraceae bacterium]|nr:PTS transporter subunit EIIC [Lachnospiraceae bacterium]